MKREGLRLTYAIYIGAPAANVWKGITDASLTKQYFYGTHLEGTLAKGSAYTYATDDGMRMVEGEVLEVEPGRRLVLTNRALWDEKVKVDPLSRVTWEITPMGDASKLSLVHDGFEGETESYRQSAEGWGVILSSLKTLLETGKPLVLGNG